MPNRPKTKKCKTADCKRLIRISDNLSGYCVDCVNARRRKEAMDTAARIAASKPNDLDRLKAENSTLNQELTRAKGIIGTYQANRSIEDRLCDEVRGYLERNPYRPQLAPFKAPKVGGKATEHEMLACISDAHFPEVVDPAQTFGIAYNGDVCKRRIEYLRDKIIRFADLHQSAYPVRKLTVNVNGDMISGDIHEELEVTNQMPTSEAMVKMAYMLFETGCAFAEHFPQVEFIVMPGNHPRVTQKPRFKQKWNNWEWVMGMFLAALAKGTFNVIVPRDLVYRHRVFDFTVGLSHGDGVKAQSFAGIPHYAMERRRTKLQSLLKQLGQRELDLLIYGHFHQLIFEEGQGCSLLVNGSIKGGDEFSTGTTYSAQSPVQALLTFHPKHGITDINRINLGHVR